MSDLMFFWLMCFLWGGKLQRKNEDGEAVARGENEKGGGNVLHRLKGGESGKGKRGGKPGSRKRGNGEKANEEIQGGKRCGVAVLGGKAGGADGGNGGAQVSKGGICLFLGGFKVGGFGAR